MEIETKPDQVGIGTSPVLFLPGSASNLYSPSSIDTIGEVSMMKHINDYGYVLIKTDDGWKREHIVVWERFNGSLHDGCLIHHLDGDRTNNDISNLEMMTNSKHGSIHHGAMLIGLEWLCECPYCHQVIYLKDHPEHISNHLRNYIGNFVSYKLISESLGVGQWSIQTKIRYNVQTDCLTVEQIVAPPFHQIFSLLNCTPEYGITLHVDYAIVGAKISILTGWRDRKPKTPEAEAEKYRLKALGKTRWTRKQKT